MVYKWKIPGLIPVDAQTAGDEIERIWRETGSISPGYIVDESRPANAPLHPCFEWNDSIAAEKYREHQAGNIIRSITTVFEDSDTAPIEVRAFVKGADSYSPISVIMQDKDSHDALLQSALLDLKAFQRKYSDLVSLAAVMESINAYLQEV